MALSKEHIYRDLGGGVLLTQNEAHLRLHSMPLVDPYNVKMVQVEYDITYTTVCLDNALRLSFFDQLFSTVCFKSNDCPLLFNSLDVSSEKCGRVVIRCANRIVEKGTNNSYRPRLSQDAIEEIRSIERIADTQNDKAPTIDIKLFLETFGSHYIKGSLETVSSFEWAVIAERNCDADILLEIAEEVFQKCKLLRDVLESSNSGIWYDISSFLKTSDWNRRKKNVLKMCKLRVMHRNKMKENTTFGKWLNLTRQKVTEQIPCMLRKFESVKPIWLLIEESHLEFKHPKPLAGLFEATWQNLVDETKHLKSLRKKWKNLQSDIGMEKYFPFKLSLQDVMALDYHLSKPSSWNEIAWDMLKRLIMIDNQFLVKPFSDYLDEMAYQGATQRMIVHSHPMDVLLLLFRTSDFTLQQVLTKKLFMCRKAIPFIVPTETDQLEIMLWPLRSIVMEWKKSDEAMEESLITHPITRISFLKFGMSGFSKSNLINDILSAHRHRVFMTRESRLVGAKRIISNGMVEMTHYSPSGKADDVFTEPIMLFNLRGDAIEFTSQEDILTKLSHVVVFIYDITEILSKAVQEKLRSTSTSRILVLLTNETHLNGDCLDNMLDEAEAFIENTKMNHIKMIQGLNDDGQSNNQMQERIVHELRMAIIEALPHLQIKSMEHSLQNGSHRNLVDEISNKDCMAGKELAVTLMKEMKRVPKEHAKETLLPLQGKVCKEMGSLLRRENREQNAKKKEEVKDQILSLREEQYIKFNVKEPFVIQYLLKPNIDDQTRLFFMKWVKMALDNECRLHLPKLQADYNLQWNNLMAAKKTADTQMIQTAQEACNIAELKVAAAGLGIEHLMREVGQIYEISNDRLTQKKLLTLAGSLLMAGYPMEIMDGDNGFIPMQWVTKVLSEVFRVAGTDKKVYVLSVLGVQSSGKSTLLNSMFGLEFAVSAGRCTRGIYAQMLLVDKNRSPQLPFDYLLVLDSEGLRAPELALKKFEHDNELATLVIGLADLTFINLKGENTAEIQDVLQIVVHAFLRMQRADSFTKRHCMFIHQNVSAINAEAKMIHGQQKMQESLDAMTVQAAAALGLEKRFTSFHDVISFEANKDILYFSDLWTGDPPMAAVNTSYSEKCALVQKQMLEQTLTNNFVGITINDFITRLQDLWKGVLADDFVFSFRNSLAAKAFISLEQQCAKHRRIIESTLSGWINKECHIQIQNCTTVQELHSCSQTMSRQLLSKAVENVEQHTDQLIQFVENHPQRDILEQWRTDKFLTFKTAVEFDTSQLEHLLGEMKERKMVVLKQQAQHRHHEQEIMKKAIELAEQMRGEKPSDDELDHTFTLMWKIWSEDIGLKEGEKGPTIISILHMILIEMFATDAGSKYLSAEMEKHKPSERTLEVPALTKDDVEPKSKSWWRKLKEGGPWWTNKSIMDQCRGIIQNMLQNIPGQIIDRVVSQGLKFHSSNGRTVLQSIFEKFDEVNSFHDDKAMFTFKPSAKAKVCLIVCDYAAERFEKMNEEFERLHGAKAKVEAYKKKIFIMFQDTVKQRTTEKNAAKYLCEAISPNIEEIVNKDMSRKVVDLILQDIGHAKFYLMLRIMQSVAQNEDFTSIQSYVTDAHTFASQWIQNYTESAVLFESRKSETKYLKIAALHVEKIIACIKEGVRKASEEKKTGLMKWISSFCKHAEQEVSITPKELKNLRIYKITNFVTFGLLLENRLSDLNIKIKNKLAKVTKDSVKWNGPNPYQEASNKLWGCRQMCPLCREPCQKADANHKANHICVQHRPSGINGAHNIHNLVLDTMTCGMNIASDRKFNFENETGKEDDFHPYKDYKKFYPQWDIMPDDAGNATEYWKWIFCKFEKQIKAWRSNCKLEIPKSWRRVTKQQALDSLRVYET